MRYRCLACDTEIEFGWLPGATTGWMLFYPLATGAGYALLLTSLCALLVLGALKRWTGADSPDWLVGVILVGVYVPSCLFFVWLLAVIPMSVEYLRVRRRPCPSCQARNWSWGYQRGFGV
jgi:hypothetical protein